MTPDHLVNSSCQCILLMQLADAVRMLVWHASLSSNAAIGAMLALCLALKPNITHPRPLQSPA